MKKTPEQDFQAYAVDGDLGALGRVFQRYTPELQCIARRLAPATPELGAEDLVQMTFVTAIEKVVEFDPGRPLSAWLVGILALHAKNARRKVSRRGQTLPLVEEPAEGSGLRSGSRSAEQPSSNHEWLAEVRAAVASAPRLYKPVLEAVLFEQRTPREAAVLLDLTPGTTRQRLRRGLSMLRDSLSRPLGALLAASFWAPRHSRVQRTELFERAARAHPGCDPSQITRLASAGPGLPLALPASLIALGSLGWLAWKAVDVGQPQASLVQGAPGLSSHLPGSTPVAQSSPSSREVLVPQDVVQASGPGQVAPGPPAMLEVSGDVFAEGSMLKLAGAEVWLQHLESASEWVATSDARGHFEFRTDQRQLSTGDSDSGGVTSHPPLIEVRAKGYGSYRVPRGSLRRALFMRSESFRNGPPQARYSFLIQLRPAHRVSGRVLDENGRPASAELFLIDALGELAGESSIGHTGPEGYFALGEVGEFFYKSARALCLVAIGSGGTGFAQVGLDLPRDLRAGQAPPPIAGVEIALANVEISVEVVDELGMPVRGALVEAKPISSLWNHPQQTIDEGRPLWLDELPEAFAERFRTLSAADGKARFLHLPSYDDPQQPRLNGESMARWMLQASAPGYLPSHCSAYPILQRIGAAQEQGQLVLRRPTLLELHGRVLDEAGEPMAGVRIHAYNTVREIHSDADGRWSWTITDLQVLPRKFICEEERHASPSFTLTAQEVEGRSRIRHDFQFERAVGFKLQLVDARGAPVSGVRVRIKRLGEPRNGIVDMGGQLTDPAGRVDYRCLPAGLYSVKIGPTWANDGVEVEPLELKLQAGEDRTVPVVVIE